MSKFLTLVKRDAADYRGALIITPIVISAVIFLLVIISSAMGKIHIDREQFVLFGDKSSSSVTITSDDGQKVLLQKDANGKLVYKDENGISRTLTDELTPDKIKKFSKVAALGSGMGAVLPLMVAAIVVLFTLSGALYDERKDKSIMFWKSLPVSDLQTVLSKAVSIVGIGFGAAIGAGIILHILISIVVLIVNAMVGIFPIDFGVYASGFFTWWGMIILQIAFYILWALPVYAWVIAASSYAPKAPFLLAFIPIFLGPLLAKMFFGDVSLLMEPLYHLSAYPIWQASGQAFETADTSMAILNPLIVELFSTLKEPSFLIGLVVAVVLIYAASEIRKRRSF